MSNQLEKAHATLSEAKSFSDINKCNFTDAVYTRCVITSLLLAKDEGCTYFIIMNAPPAVRQQARNALMATILVRNRDCLKSICSIIIRRNLMPIDEMHIFLLKSNFVGAIEDHIPRGRAMQHFLMKGDKAMTGALRDAYFELFTSNRHLSTLPQFRDDETSILT